MSASLTFTGLACAAALAAAISAARCRSARSFTPLTPSSMTCGKRGKKDRDGAAVGWKQGSKLVACGSQQYTAQCAPHHTASVKKRPPWKERTAYA